MADNISLHSVPGRCLVVMLCAFYIDLRITVHINVTAILTDLRLHPVLVQLRGDDPWLDHSPAGSGVAGQQVREDFVQLYYV